MTDLLAIDPGTTTSPTALVVLRGGTIVAHAELSVDKKLAKKAPDPFTYRLQKIVTGVKEFYDLWQPQAIIVEVGVYQGKANVLLNQLIGALKYEIGPFQEVNPMTVKKQIAGHGKAEKEQLAQALLRLYPSQNHGLILDWMASGRYDLTDAAAIAACSDKRGF